MLMLVLLAATFAGAATASTYAQRSESSTAGHKTVCNSVQVRDGETAQITCLIGNSTPASKQVVYITTKNISKTLIVCDRADAEFDGNCTFRSSRIASARMVQQTLAIVIPHVTRDLHGVYRLFRGVKKFWDASFTIAFHPYPDKGNDKELQDIGAKDREANDIKSNNAVPIDGKATHVKPNDVNSGHYAKTTPAVFSSEPKRNETKATEDTGKNELIMAVLLIGLALMVTVCIVALCCWQLRKNACKRISTTNVPTRVCKRQKAEAAGSSSTTSRDSSLVCIAAEIAEPEEETGAEPEAERAAVRVEHGIEPPIGMYRRDTKYSPRHGVVRERTEHYENLGYPRDEGRHD